jgi:hypothetical protein
MKKKRIFAYLRTPDAGKTTAALEAIKCGLSNVVKSGCRYCGGQSILSFDNDKYYSSSN